MSKKKDERQFKIRQLLQEHPKIKISDLSDYCQTSSEPLRKDIIELEDSKIIKKEHGYALLLEEPDEMPISLRNQEYIEEKKQIMRQTCTFIKEGMVVYLDAGSTCQAGIPFLQSIHNITIVTNSIFVAYKCAKLNMHVILIGGNISNNAYRSYGNFASETIDYIHIDVAILGTKGFKDNNGFTTYENEYELMRRGRRRGRAGHVHNGKDNSCRSPVYSARKGKVYSCEQTHKLDYRRQKFKNELVGHCDESKLSILLLEHHSIILTKGLYQAMSPTCALSVKNL